MESHLIYLKWLFLFLKFSNKIIHISNICSIFESTKTNKMIKPKNESIKKILERIESEAKNGIDSIFFSHRELSEGDVVLLRYLGFNVDEFMDDSDWYDDCDLLRDESCTMCSKYKVDSSPFGIISYNVYWSPDYDFKQIVKDNFKIDTNHMLNAEKAFEISYKNQMNVADTIPKILTAAKNGKTSIKLDKPLNSESYDFLNSMGYELYEKYDEEPDDMFINWYDVKYEIGTKENIQKLINELKIYL